MELDLSRNDDAKESLLGEKPEAQNYGKFLLLIGFVLILIGGIGGGIESSSNDESSNSQHPGVVTTGGRIQGLRVNQSGSIFDEYLGIPYAQAPLGDLRWADPIPPTPWNGTRDGSIQAPGCLQSWFNTYPETVPADLSEDCLFLNVFTPPGASSNPANLSVLVWIHGGAYSAGGSSAPLYYGGILAANTNSIVVTLNYRLGAFGFLYTGISGGITGNYGLKDQRLALQWVQDNIHNFGGLNDKVTIFGESAGAMSISIHLIRPDTNNLYQRAILQSNPVVEADTIDEAYGKGTEFASKVGCGISDAKCLRAISTSKIWQLSLQYTWQPTIDYIYIPNWPLTALRNGLGNKVPLIIGTTQHETGLFLASFYPNPMSDSEYQAYLTQSYGNSATEIETLYPPNGGDNRIQVALLTTHEYWTCPNYQFASASWYNNSNTVWTYSYEHIGSFYATQNVCNITVCHGAEVPLVLNTINYASKGVISLTPEEDILSMKIGNYWANFSLTGEANWPHYIEGEETNTIIFVPTIRVESNYLKPYCEYWDSRIQTLQ